jgi:hypothetical protein
MANGRRMANSAPHLVNGGCKQMHSTEHVEVELRVSGIGEGGQLEEHVADNGVVALLRYGFAVAMCEGEVRRRRSEGVEWHVRLRPAIMA